MRTSRLHDIRRNNKTEYDVRKERDSGQARLLNFKNNKKVEIRWGMNEATKADQIFELRVGNEEVLLSNEDIQRFLRWI